MYLRSLEPENIKDFVQKSMKTHNTILYFMFKHTNPKKTMIKIQPRHKIMHDTNTKTLNLELDTKNYLNLGLPPKKRLFYVTSLTYLSYLIESSWR